MRRRMSSRETKRLMKRMGVGMSQVSNVREVVIRTDTKEIKILNPEVAILDMSGQKIFQVVGDDVTERTIGMKVLEEDVLLVVNQTGKTFDEAKRALEETEGDLAKAILLLQT